VKLGEDEVGHEEVAMVLQPGRLHLGVADEGGQLVIETRDHFAEKQGNLLGEYTVCGLLDQLEKTHLPLLHHILNGVDLLLTPV
jgi:hypothetical protein